MSRNVEALTSHLNAVDLRMTAATVAEIAEQLAARGVLAVDSLTDEQIWEGPLGAHKYPVGTSESFRDALRRCATGEDT